MNRQYSDNVWKILACPNCGESIQRADRGALCRNCRIDFEYTDSGALDFRLKRPRKYRFEFQLGTPVLPETGFDFTGFSRKDSPEVDFRGLRMSPRLSKEVMSYIPKAKTKHSLALDLGCGSTRFRGLCEHAGFEYVGLDYDSAQSPLLGDAHALPFKAESFEFILSIAVLEHLRFPFVGMAEAYRVLEHGGIFIGSVAFLQPFHGNSFYHHTHLGVYNSLQEGGFKVQRVAPQRKYPGLVAQAQMALFPRMPKLLSRSLVMPLQLLHILWWRIGSRLNPQSSEENRIKKTTASFAFVATKESR